MAPALLLAMLAALSLAAERPSVALAATHDAATQSCGSNPTATSTPSQSAASISLSKTQGPPGMFLSLTGSGWPAGIPVVVDVDVPQPDGTILTLVSVGIHTKASADGTLPSTPVQVPRMPGCSAVQYANVLFVAHTTDNSVGAQAPFTYMATPTLESQSYEPVRPNVAVSLSGQNWEPGEQVTITSGVLSSPHLPCAPQVPPLCENPTKPVPSATTHTNADDHGQISLSYVLPVGLPPRTAVLVQATGTGPQYGTIAAAPIEFLIGPALDPTITLERSQGAPGVAVVVRGDRWYPGDAVTLEYCRGEDGASIAPNEPRCPPQSAQWLGQTTVDTHGRFSRTLSVPTNARVGPILIQARVENDVMGLVVYAQAAPFQIVPPPLPWSQQHPRLALAVAIAQPAAPAAALGVLLLAAYIWSRRQQHRVRTAGVRSTSETTPAEHSRHP